MVILDRRLRNGKDFYTKMILAFHVYFPLNLILNFFFSIYYCRYVREFGFTIPNRQILIDDIRVRGTGHSKTSVSHEIPKASTPPPVKKVFLRTSFRFMFILMSHDPMKSVLENLNSLNMILSNSTLLAAKNFLADKSRENGLVTCRPISLFSSPVCWMRLCNLGEKLHVNHWDF